ncbi:hypothetical protein MOQ_005705 [Trypanosoma cruzi marinkellei]|uniref:Uncharacterized protein n=1 Tax=Trypanosoma cruzi marinkellei TaxID=85056 RepID=K2N748_TRYCR|nr:hypothetical protein MOQ_005705 [Trypanosoma cruzi marinkellei]
MDEMAIFSSGKTNAAEIYTRNASTHESNENCEAIEEDPAGDMEFMPIGRVPAPQPCKFDSPFSPAAVANVDILLRRSASSRAVPTADVSSPCAKGNARRTVSSPVRSLGGFAGCVTNDGGPSTRGSPHSEREGEDQPCIAVNLWSKEKSEQITGIVNKDHRQEQSKWCHRPVGMRVPNSVKVKEGKEKKKVKKGIQTNDAKTIKKEKDKIRGKCVNNNHTISVHYASSNR